MKLARRILEKMTVADRMVGRFFKLKNGKLIYVTKCKDDSVVASPVVAGRAIHDKPVVIPLDKFDDIVTN